MNRVVVTRPIVGICFMQVCAVSDATDEEILVVANADNTAGTERGWTTVFRDNVVTCAQDSSRVHLMVGC